MKKLLMGNLVVLFVNPVSAAFVYYINDGLSYTFDDLIYSEAVGLIVRG